MLIYRVCIIRCCCCIVVDTDCWFQLCIRIALSCCMRSWFLFQKYNLVKSAFSCDLCCLMSREQLHYRSHNMCKFLSIFDLSDILLSRHYTMHHIFMLSNFLLHDLIFNTIDHVPETWILMFRFLWSNEILILDLGKHRLLDRLFDFIPLS